MYIADILDDIDRVRAALVRISEESMHWTVDDFIFKAYDLEGLVDADPNVELGDISPTDAREYLKKYDYDKFHDALKLMIYKHDASVGITWDTIEYYLDEHCVK